MTTPVNTQKTTAPMTEQTQTCSCVPLGDASTPSTAAPSSSSSLSRTAGEVIADAHHEWLHWPSMDALARLPVGEHIILRLTEARFALVYHPPVECTGVAATWCPIHGDCTCSYHADGEPSFDDSDCPLHSLTSTHGDDGTPVDD